jgi:hypothetical protein
MATYSSFKKIDSAAIIDGQILSSDIAPTTIPSIAIQNSAVTSSKMSGVVTSDKIASSIDLSSKTVTYRPIVNNDISNTAGIVGTKLAAGAAVTNLGYTPVNAAGDTMTGILQMPAGSVSAPPIRQSASSNTGIYFPTTNNIAFTTGGSNRIQIGPTHVQMFQRPHFQAVGTTGWFYGNTFGGGEHEIRGTWGWSLQYQGGGSGWDNGRYIAPVSGYYHFNTMWYLLNDANTAPHYVHLFFRRNNTRAWTAGGRNPYTINMHSTTSNYDDGASYAAVMQLNANDFCSLAIVWHGFSSRIHAGHQFFNGHLIG